MRIYLLTLALAAMCFLNCSSSSSPALLLPNNAPCTHHEQCQSQICCGTLGVDALCAATCPAPNKPATLDFCQTGERPMLVTNQSTKTLWLGATSGSISATKATDCANFGGTYTPTASVPGPHGTVISTGGVCTCTTANPQCGSLASCAITTTVPGTSSGHYCFWNPPRLVGVTSMSMTPQATLKLCFPSLASTGGNFQWSGNMFARFGCDSSGQNCTSANCSNNVTNPPGTPSCPNATCPAGCTPGAKNCPALCKTTGTGCGPGYQLQNGHTYAQDCPNNGTCAPQDGSCILGQGGAPPAALAEFTLTGLDYYDISIINGINMGISMVPDPTTTTQKSTDPYFCGGTGAKQQPSNQQILRACPWTITPSVPNLKSPYITSPDQTNLLRSVSPVFVNNIRGQYNYCGNSCNSYTGLNGQICLPCQSGQSCPPCPNFNICPKDTSCVPVACPSPCPNGQVCGLAQSVAPGGLQQYAMVCGFDQNSWWSADQICGTITQGNSPLNIPPLPCSTDGSLNGNNLQNHFVDLFECTNSDGFSCYQSSSGSGQKCGDAGSISGTFVGCGCPTSSNNPYRGSWPTVLPDAPECSGDNPDWNTYIQPWLVFMKLACPTAYTFPYDDVTSTFTCSAKSGVPAGSGPGYYITFFDITYIVP